MKTILAITSSTNCKIELIVCESIDDAIGKMKTIYEKLCSKNYYDYYNTFLDEEVGYAQIVNGLEQTEFRVGTLSIA